MLSCKPEGLSSAMGLYVSRDWVIAAVATRQDLERAVGGPCRTASAQHGQQAAARRGAEAAGAGEMDLRLLQEQLAKVRITAPKKFSLTCCCHPACCRGAPGLTFLVYGRHPSRPTPHGNGQPCSPNP